MLKQIARRILRKELKEQKEKATITFKIFKEWLRTLVYDKQLGIELLDDLLFSGDIKIENPDFPPIDLLIFEANAADLFLVEDGDVLPKSKIKISVYPSKINDEDWMYLDERSIVAVNSKNAGLNK